MLPLFPIALPAAPSATRNNLDVAVARRIGPLFGVYDPGSPFARSWVVDVRQVLLKELAQGSPDSTDPSAVLASATGETKIAPTTVNRFGPDARASLVLEAVNTLLRDDIGHICAMLQFDLDRMHAAGFAGGRSSVARALAVWATAVGEIWASHPVLVWAGIWARDGQRSADYDVRSAPRMIGAAWPSEYGYLGRRQANVVPTALGIVDDVVDWLRSARYSADGSRVVDRPDAQWLEGAAQHLVAVLAEVAQPEGDQPGVVWVPPLPREDERVATAYVVPFQIVREFARRQGVDQVDLAVSLQQWRVEAAQTMTAAADTLAARSLALYLRTMDVLAEWATRAEAGAAALAPADHVGLQDRLLEAARQLPAAANSGTAVFREGVLRFAELRATACSLRAASGDELVAAADLVVARLDELVAWTAARRGPTGPALAQLSRATSDLFAALERAGGSVDAAWTRIHTKIGEYWQFYRLTLAEGLAEDGSQGAVDHYLGNVAGYLAAVDLAPSDANRTAMLTQALDLLISRIIPYRRRRADRRADWEDFLATAYLRAAQCAVQLAESAVDDDDVVRNANLASALLASARDPHQAGHSLPNLHLDPVESSVVIDALEARVAAVLATAGALTT